MLSIQIYPSNTRPHFLERLGSEDGVFIRVGSTNRTADAIQIEELRRMNWMNSFDERAIPDLKPEVLDFRAASELFAPYRKLTSQAWNTLRKDQDVSESRNGSPVNLTDCRDGYEGGRPSQWNRLMKHAVPDERMKSILLSEVHSSAQFFFQVEQHASREPRRRPRTGLDQ